MKSKYANNTYAKSIAEEFHLTRRPGAVSLRAALRYPDSRVVKVASLYACAAYGRPYKDCIGAYKAAKRREKAMRNPATWKLSREAKRAVQWLKAAMNKRK
ncbi:hypothetical protein PaoP5_170 [Pseudomonas phage PaoP5]|uniref:Uncharacterized protein n=1 Tax=Pseudomonas phage PaGz-1 TaxID=2419748 RepID=A0A411B8Y1_9CAUD|nr:hypothetical protein PaoP5_170 [Pseudomonas phage PaoP5]YP_010762118.1 hypothetical protein QE322_gp168 [Pseudomonas phage PaGz-1]ALT58449.1 hypothetical protein PaoP5_170 [Pseudomonas phage PaoP5]QAX98062.1 hypothetical protein [Pseudomonas phage PaGz-1]